MGKKLSPRPEPSTDFLPAPTCALLLLIWLHFPQLGLGCQLAGLSDSLLFPFPPTCFHNQNQCSNPFILSADCLHRGRVYQAPAD